MTQVGTLKQKECENFGNLQQNGEGLSQNSALWVEICVADWMKRELSTSCQNKNINTWPYLLTLTNEISAVN